METEYTTARSSRLATAGRAIVAIFVVGVGTFALLELSVRISLFGVAGFDPRRIPIFRDFDHGVLADYSPKSMIAYEYVPNQDRAFRAVRFRTNSHGLRDREYSVDKPPDTVRVAVIGSSFTLPLGVEIEDSFHSVLERRLTAEFAPASYEFINFAVGAHGTNQMIGMLLQRALVYEPDLILFSLTGLAVPSMLRPWDRKSPQKMLEAMSPKVHRSLLVRLVKTRLGLERTRMPEAQFAYPPGSIPRKNAIWKLGRVRRETGTPIVVVRLAFDPVPPSDLEGDVMNRCRAAGLFYLDTRSGFQGRNPRDFWVHQLDPHPNRNAHAIFAEVLEKFLSANDLLEH